MLLHELFDVRHIKPALESRTKEQAFQELIAAAHDLHPELDREEMLDAVVKREKLMNTAVSPGVAVPHGYCRALEGVIGVIGVSREGIAYDTEDQQPVHCVILLLLGASCRERHLRILSRLLKLLDSQSLKLIIAARTAQEIHGILQGL